MMNASVLSTCLIINILYLIIPFINVESMNEMETVRLTPFT